MQVESTALPEVKLITPRVFSDTRGWFYESWQQQRYHDAGITVDFVQTNVSCSHHGVMRGLHFQQPQPQGKLVHVLQGSVWDVAVDIRPDSPTFTRWVSAELNDDNHQQLWIPAGFAHGFQVLSETAVFAYFCSCPYYPEYDAAVSYKDPQININWPLPVAEVSAKDAQAPLLNNLDKQQLPAYQ